MRGTLRRGKTVIFILHLALLGPCSPTILADETHEDALRAISRWTHAKELLGNYYHQSVVKTGESLWDMDELIHQWTENALKKQWKHYSKSIADTVIRESNKYGFDPVFVLAIIENESNFNPVVTGSFGEIGLMQILP